MRKIYLLSTLVLTLLIGSKSYAQDFSNKGKDFWVGYGYHTQMIPANGNSQDMVLYFATDQVTNITITIPATGYIQNITTPAGNNVVTSAVIPKTGLQDARLLIGGLSNNGIHITSDKPMVAYAHIYNGSCSGATILYPTNTLGREYYSVNYKNWSNLNNANCWFYVLATDTGTTTIQITPQANQAGVVTTASSGGWVAGTTYTVNLTQGQIYNVMGILTATGNPNTGVDLTGSKVISINNGSGCKKISVFSGSGRISISCDLQSSSSDNYMVQAMPKNAWGKKYLTVQANGNQANNIYRVCVSHPAAIVRINGAVTGLPLINNFYYEIPQTNQPQLIESDSAIMVAQYFTSQGECGNGTPGDPEVIYLSAVEQSINKVLWNATPNFAINSHFFNVVIPNTGTAISSFRLDGAAVGGWVTHPQEPGYSYLRMAVGAGPRVIQSDSGFNAIAYGFASAESYGYNAGTNIKDLYQQIGVETEYGIEPTPSVCTNSPFKFKVSLPYCADSIKWNLSNLPGPPVPSIITMLYSTCTPGAGGPDSTTIVNGRTIYWYSLPSFYSFSIVGIFPVNIFTYSPNGECGTVQEIEFDLSVSNPPVADFTWTSNGCAIQPVQFTETTPQVPKTTYRFWWDFGDPASGPLNNSTVRNPVHQFTGPGTYTVRYASITTPGCLSDTITKQITLTDPPSATYSVNPPLCVNVPIQFNDQTIPPPGATIAVWAWNFGDPGSGPLNISSVQNPTHIYTNPGTYTVTLQVETNSGCPSAVYSSQVTIAPDATVTLRAGDNNNQTVCINNVIADIRYDIGGSGNGGTVSGLPTGVTGIYVSGVITISGIPTQSGVFNYTINPTGPCALPVPAVTGTITVTADATITLNSGPGSDNQTKCINTLIDNIDYLVGGSGTGATISWTPGVPPGITFTPLGGGIFRIAGTPTVSNTFNYTVSTTGPCIRPTATGSLTVTPDATVTLRAGDNNNQTVCINNVIADIRYDIGGSGNGGTVSGLPTGVTGIYVSGVITISGIPIQSGVFNYTINPTGPCALPVPAVTGTITVTADGTLTLTSATGTDAQELCKNSTIADITYLFGQSATSASVTGLPPGVTWIITGNLVTISGSPTVAQPGPYTYTVSTTGPCVTPSLSGTILVNELPTANFNSTVPSCQTRTINFFDISVPNSGNIISWAWNFGDPPSGPDNTSNLQNPSHTYANAGVYNVSLVVTTDKGCISITPPRQVTINDRPLAGFIIPEVCLSDTYAQFTDTSKLANAAIDRWDWDFGDPGSGPLNISSLQNPTHSYTATGNYSVRLIVWNNAIGCRDTITQTLTVNGSFPNADFTVNNPTTLCANDSVSIAEASTVFPGSITKVEIYWDNVGQPGVFDTDNFPVTGKIYKHLYPNFQAPLTRTFTIRYRAYSGGVCVNDRLRNITVNAAPLVQFNNVPNICYDAAPYQIPPAIASETGGVPGNGVFSGPGVSPTGLFSPAVAGPGTHRILYTFTSTAGGCIDTASNTIRVWDTASAQIGVQALACERSSVSFNSTNSTIPPGNGSITGWAWNFGDPPSGASNTSSLSNPSHLFTGWGNYNVSLNVLTSNGCRSTVRTIPVDVKPVPRPNFSFPISSCLPSATVAFNSSASSIPDGTAFQSYLWNFGDPASGALNTSTGANPSHIYNNVGPFTVNLQITSSVGCVRDTNIILNTIHPQPLAAITSNKNDVCVGQSFTFTDNSDPADGTTISRNWTMGDGGVRTNSPVNYTYAAAGTYNVTLYIINSHGCRSTTATRTVTVNPYPIVNAGPDLFILEDGSDTLETIITAINPTYLWTPNLYFLGSNTVKNPVVKGVDDITYTLTVTGQGGCASSDEVFIKVLKGPEIPNIFSPNGDGIHDTWLIKYLDTYPGCTVDIFNRYGQLIYHIVGYGIPWDGKINGNPVPMGTYYYIVNPKNGRKIMSGYVDVIR